MMLDPNKVIVKYRYVITMSDAYKPYPKVIDDWTTGKKFKNLYDGKLMLLVSPIYYIDKTDDVLVQLQLDIEGKKTDLETLFNKCVRFIKKNKDTYFTYTGKTGFHIYSNYVYYIPNGKSMKIQNLRNLIINKYDLDDLVSHVDYISSIRHMPTIRIGMRPDTNKLAFPILYNRYSWFKKALKGNSFINIISKQQLKQFLRTNLIPIHNIRRI